MTESVCLSLCLMSVSVSLYVLCSLSKTKKMTINILITYERRRKLIIFDTNNGWERPLSPKNLADAFIQLAYSITAWSICMVTVITIITHDAASHYSAAALLAMQSAVIYLQQFGLSVCMSVCPSDTRWYPI